MKFIAGFEKVENGWAVFLPQLPGCNAWGENVAQAEANACELACEWIEDASSRDSMPDVPAKEVLEDLEYAAGEAASPSDFFVRFIEVPVGHAEAA